MTNPIVLATRNTHKLQELQRIIAASDVDVEVLGSDAFSGLPDIEETGSTFAANALLKARAVAAYTGLPSIGDDSGLCVDALNGMPGIFSARWSGGHGDDAANLALLLAQLQDVPDERRDAHFVCAIAIVVPAVGDEPARERVVDGSFEGALVRQPRGTNGFGYDPIFRPYGLAITSAEMMAEDKDALSHRGLALRALVPVLRTLLT